MSEQHKVVDGLESAGVLAGIRWAFTSATDRVLADYSEAAGHDATWIGTTRFILFRDRLDRVFVCNRYALRPGSDAETSFDIVAEQLTEKDIATMPRIPPDVAIRSNVNGSPGWRALGTRWLLASCAYGKIDKLPWPQKSQTKQRIAKQPFSDPAQGSLFDNLAIDEIAGLAALLEPTTPLDIPTLVVAHSQDGDHGGRELNLGRAQLNAHGGKAWHWKHDLLSAAPGAGGAKRDEPVGPTGPNTEPDAPVRLRQLGRKQENDSGSGSA